MSTEFDASVIEGHGWRQGAVLGPGLIVKAREHAPLGLTVADDDWLIVTSHDCDVVNKVLEKEPTIEVLRAAVVAQRRPNSTQVGGRNPRETQFEAEGDDGTRVVLRAKVHERWTLPRGLLAEEAPVRFLDNKTRRMIAEWLAKRYIRAAFPSAFDRRWHSKMRDWTALLEAQTRWVQGVYLRLNTLSELEDGSPYEVDLFVASPEEVAQDGTWAAKKSELEDLVRRFWGQFNPGITCVGVDVRTTDDLTLADIEPYQRFDADWVSFADDSPSIPIAADMQR